MKNPIIAFLLAFFPGGGLLYLGKIVRGFFYTMTVFGLLFLGILGANFNSEKIFFLLGIPAFFIYVINFIDTAITASRVYHAKSADVSGSPQQTPESERFFTIILSFIPGVGHFQLGLMNRGLTLLAAFLGLGVMVLFVSALAHRGEFLVFLAFLPIIWIYSFFDSMQQLNKKQRGEMLVDRSLLEEFEERRESGKKSKAVATFLSIFPGAGHLYLGLQRRGIQLMAGFLFSIYILDVLRLGIFLFLVPIIWFYSFFDGLQKASKEGTEELEDTPVISYFINHQRWVGIGLLLLGLYYLTGNVLLPAVSPIINRLIDIDVTYWFDSYFQTFVVSVLLIGGGIKLMAGSKRKQKERRGAQMRTWRVGTISMGASLVFLGIFLLFTGLFDWNGAEVMMAWWPVLLIILGGEILLYLYFSKQEKANVKYDFLSILFVGVLGTLGIGLTLLSTTGIMDKITGVMAAETRTENLPEFNQTFDQNIKRIVIRTEDQPVTVEGSSEKGVAIFGTYRADMNQKENLINTMGGICPI